MSITVTLNIPAISCGHCVKTITLETADLPGVISATGNPQEKTATFTLEYPEALDAVKATLVEIGYPAV